MAFAFLKFHPLAMASEGDAKPVVKGDLSNQCNPDALDDRLTERLSTHIPPEARIRMPDKICLGQMVILQGSDSHSRDRLSLQYHWDLGDGTTAEGMTVNKRFEKAGIYRVGLTVQDSSRSACGSNTTYKDIQVIEPPVAIAGEDVSACLGEGIKFQGSSTNKDALAYFAQWDFRDGKREQGLQVRHIYDRPGIYHALLTVQDPFTIACPESTAQRTVKVYASLEIALNASQRAICVNQEVFFEAISSDFPGTGHPPLEYFWNFGEGDAILKNGSRTSHTFTKPSTYKVSVIVDDDRGTECSSHSASVEIQVDDLSMMPHSDH